MLLTVLGRYGPFPRPGGACSAYLLTEGETNVLLECGAGAYARLAAHVRPQELDAAVLSHLHFDHCSDMPVLRYAREACGAPALPVYAPNAPADGYALIDRAAFAPAPLADGQTFRIGALRFTARRVRHPVETYGFGIEGRDGARLFYTGDTAYFAELCGYAHAADALLADACALDRDAPDGKARNHMTARQAGELARQAGAARLLLTHVWGGGYTGAELIGECAFPGAEVVREGAQYRIIRTRGA